MAKALLLTAFAAVMVLVPPALAVLDLDYAVSIVTQILIFGLVGLSLNLILGFGGMVSFGHAAFFGIGAYVVGILAQHAAYGQPILTWPVTVPGTMKAVIAWPLAMLVAALFALAIGAICLRTGGLSFIMITLAFAQMIFYFFISLDSYGGEDGLSLLSRSKTGPVDIGDDRQFYYLVAAILAAFLFLKHRLIHSPFGAVLQGIRDNEARMRALGYPTYRYKLTAFVIAGAVAGLAGALIANQTQFISPSFLDWHRSGEIMVIVILGGIGSLFGPLLGSAAFLLLRDVLSQWTEHWMIFLGPVLVLVVLFAKQGLWGLVRRIGGLRG